MTLSTPRIALAAAVGLIASTVPGILWDSPAYAGTQKCSGERATIVGTGDADVIRGTQRADVIVAGGGSDSIRGRGGRDIICGSSGDDVIFAGGGAFNKSLGGAGSDIIIGDRGLDVLDGGSGIDALLGAQGDDKYQGGGGFDLAAFLASESAVIVSLSDSRARGEGRDSLNSIEGVIGSSKDDTIVGDAGNNFFFGYLGNDTIDGLGQADFVLYGLAEGGVQVDLAEDWASGEGSDVLRSVEGAAGSPFDDTLLGDSGDNVFLGDEGYDEADGREGINTCFVEVRTNCLSPLPESDVPPETPSRTSNKALGLVDQALAETRHGQPHTPPDQRSRAAALEDQGPEAALASGSLSCPFMANTAVLQYPQIQGYGFYAYRVLYAYGGSHGPWQYGPLLYYDGYWRARDNNYQWSYVYGSTNVGGTNALLQAYYYSYAYGQYYFVGQCQVQNVPIGIGDWVYTG
jgi:RTX calcium-binding nonapeptide repeat (4 copies)